MDATIDGTRLSWQEAGGGERVLLLVHGFPFNASMWRPQLADPPAGWRLIAPDLRGFGASGPATGARLGMDRFAVDLAALLRHLGIARVTVCGLSMGGYIAFALRRGAPKLVAGLVLCDTRAGPDSPKAREKRLHSAERVRMDGTAGVIEGMLPRLLSPVTKAHRPELVDEVRAMMEAAPAQSVAGALIGMAERPDSTPLLRTIDVPTLIMVGADDEITPPGDARMMARGIRGARLEIIDDAAHLPNLEQPATFNRLLGGI